MHVKLPMQGDLKHLLILIREQCNMNSRRYLKKSQISYVIAEKGNKAIRLSESLQTSVT
jgi:hypothetical protein